MTDLPCPDRTAALIAGLARQAVTHRQLYAVVLQDVTTAELRDGTPGMAATFQRLRAGLAGLDADGEVLVRVSIFLAGLAGPALDPALADLDDDALERAIVEAGHRLLTGQTSLAARHAAT